MAFAVLLLGVCALRADQDWADARCRWAGRYSFDTLQYSAEWALFGASAGYVSFCLLWDLLPRVG